jgi:hypothetical protein
MRGRPGWQTRLCDRASYGLMAILLHPYLPSKINRLRLPARETPNRMHSLLRLRIRGRVLRGLCGPVLLAALAAAGCGDDPITNPDAPTPTAVTETYTGTVTINGAITQPFVVQTAGTVSAAFTALEPAEARLGLSIGTWNGVVCAIVLANDDAPVGASVTGSATATGNYCVRVYDVGKLTQAVEYQLTVTHF